MVAPTTPAPSKKTTSPAQGTDSTPVVPAGKKGKKAKPTKWRRMADLAVRYCAMVADLKKMATAGADAKHVAQLKNMSESIPSEEGGEEIAFLVTSLHKLDADQVPVPNIPKAPRFAKGDKVRIRAKDVSRYTADGLFSVSGLASLVVAAVSENGRSCLCMDPAGLTVLVRYAKHLEKR